VATGLQFSMDGKSYDIDDFTLGDLEWLEEHIGMPLSDDGALTSMKTMVGFVFLIKRRDNPSFTIEEARQVKLSTLDAGETGEGEGEDLPAGKRPTKAARSSSTRAAGGTPD
jgi:hypothetical protein